MPSKYPHGAPQEQSEQDQYSRVEYRKLIAWKKRIEREGPFLRGLIERAPDRSVLDIGCGTGEHTAFFAELGCRAVGLDASESMIEAARDHERAGLGRYVLGDGLAAREALGDESPFGLALCLGNMLPHVEQDEELERFVTSVHDALLPGGALLLQMLNYAGFLARGVRHLPLNFRPGEDGREIVFLRVLNPEAGGRVLFFPTVLELDPEAEEPVRVHSTKRIEMRAWTADDLVPRLGAHGFDVRLYGDMQGGAFDPVESHDLVLVGTRGNDPGARAS